MRALISCPSSFSAPSLVRPPPQSGARYGSKFNAVAAALNRAFGEQVEVVGNAKAPRASAFEIVLESGELIHSKLNGGGFPEPNDVVERVRPFIK
eukprot:tig00020911_g15741.t1